MSVLTLGHHISGNLDLPETGKTRVFYNASTKNFYKLESDGNYKKISPVAYKQTLQQGAGNIVVDHSAGDIQYIYLTSSKDVSLKNPIIDRTVYLDVEIGPNGVVYLPTGSNDPAILTNDSEPISTTNGDRNIISFHCIDSNLQSPVYLATVGTTTIPNLTIETPEEIEGLAVWFDADSSYITLSGSDVTQWTDRSSGYIAENTSSINRPTYNTNTLNGKNSLTFTRANDEHLFSNNSSLSDALSAEDNYTIFTVAKRSSSFNAAFNLSFGASGSSTENVALGCNNFGQLRVLVDSNLATSTNKDLRDNEWHILTGIVGASINNDEWYGRIDGLNEFVETETSVTAPTVNQLMIGKRINNETTQFDGGIAEIIIYNRQLTDSEINQIEEYLFQKYFSVYNLDSMTVFYQFNSGSSVEAS